jgi:hypothetical protein
MHSVANQAIDPSAMLLAIAVSANGRIDAREGHGAGRCRLGPRRRDGRARAAGRAIPTGIAASHWRAHAAGLSI